MWGHAKMLGEERLLLGLRVKAWGEGGGCVHQNQKLGSTGGSIEGRICKNLIRGQIVEKKEMFKEIGIQRREGEVTMLVFRKKGNYDLRGLRRERKRGGRGGWEKEKNESVK